MLETFCLSVLGSGGVAGIFFALIRHYIERRLMEVEAREQERIKYKIEQRKADEEITHATGRVLFWLHHAIVKGEHNGELEEAFENLQRAEAHKKEMDREVLAKYSIPYAGMYIVQKEDNNEYTLTDAMRILRSDEFKEYVFKIGIPISGKSVRITSKDIENYMF